MLHNPIGTSHPICSTPERTSKSPLLCTWALLEFWLHLCADFWKHFLLWQYIQSYFTSTPFLCLWSFWLLFFTCYSIVVTVLTIDSCQLSLRAIPIHDHRFEVRHFHHSFLRILINRRVAFFSPRATLPRLIQCSLSLQSRPGWMVQLHHLRGEGKIDIDFGINLLSWISTYTNAAKNDAHSSWCGCLVNLLRWQVKRFFLYT